MQEMWIHRGFHPDFKGRKDVAGPQSLLATPVKVIMPSCDSEVETAMEIPGSQT
jgi:hypothetical protein